MNKDQVRAFDRLIPVGVRGFKMICAGCKKIVNSHELLWADPQGKSFEDYYCEECMQRFQAEKIRLEGGA